MGVMCLHEIHRQTDKHTHTHKHAERVTKSEDGHTSAYTHRQTDRQRQTDWLKGRQISRQTDRLIHTHTHTHTQNSRTSISTQSSYFVALCSNIKLRDKLVLGGYYGFC